MKPAEKLWVWLAEGFGVGRIPVAPGTFGSILGLGWCWLLLRVSPTLLHYLIGTLALTLAAVWIGHRAEKALGKEDPGQIVIDEICAIPIAAMYLVFTFGSTLREWPAWPWWVGIFVLFRLFDVWKPWPVRQIQVLPRGWGLVLDDVLAALYVNILLASVQVALQYF